MLWTACEILNALHGSIVLSCWCIKFNANPDSTLKGSNVKRSFTDELRKISMISPGSVSVQRIQSLHWCCKVGLRQIRQPRPILVAVAIQRVSASSTQSSHQLKHVLKRQLKDLFFFAFKLSLPSIFSLAFERPSSILD